MAENRFEHTPARGLLCQRDRRRLLRPLELARVLAPLAQAILGTLAIARLGQAFV